jgi:predicted ATPase
VRETYTYARQLCQDVEDPYQLFTVLRGLWNYYLVRAEYQTAHILGEQLLTLAQQAQDTAMLVAAHRALGSTLLWLGAVASSHPHFAQGIALYDSQQHRASAFLYGEDAGVMCHIYTAWTLWYLGSPDQGLARSHEAVTLARQIAHPYSLSFALSMAAIFHQFRREVRATQELAEATISLAKEQGFPLWMAFGSIMRGWALVHQGQAQEGIAQIEQGLIAWRATGAELGRPVLLTLLAEAYGTMEQTEAGLYRLKGALLLQQSSSNQTEAELCFHQAIAIAQYQSAKSWELRAATSLARLWHQQGKHQEAHALLGPVSHWFTEGFDTADLQDAKAWLEELAG